MQQDKGATTGPKQIRFRHQIMALMLSIILIMTASVILVAVPASLYSERVVTFDRLKSANRLKEYWITRELKEITSNLRVLSENESLVEEVRFLTKLLPADGDKKVLAKLAKSNSRQWQFGDIGSLYWQSYRRLHAYFRFTDSTYPNSDVLLIRPDDGLIMYRFNRNDGLFNYVGKQTTALAQCVYKAANNPHELIYNDLQRLSDDRVKGCTAKAIVVDDVVIAVLVLRYSPDLINFIMTKRPGLGETGETYIVGKDRYLRTDSRFYQESTLMNMKVETEAIDRAYIEGAGQGIIKNYRGDDVFSVWTPIHIDGLDWVMVAEIGKDEAYGSVRDSFLQLALFSVVAFIVLVALAYGFAKRTEKPLLALLEGARSFARGGYDERLSADVTSKEVGDLIDTFNDMASQIKERSEALEAARLAAELATRDAEKANLAKSEFLSRMSHELRTPLNGVLGYAQLLKGDVRLDATQHETLVSIESCGQHLLELINDVLDIAKIESGELQVDFQRCRLSDIVDNVANVVRPRAMQKGIEFEIELLDIPEEIVIDSMKLRQILINLLGNAIKFTHRGSVVLRLSTLASTHELLLQVIDTGIGIPAEKLREIFSPFKQTAEGRKEGGSGLGLAISQQLCIALGGTFEVDSELGVGSCFSFTLPLTQRDEGVQNQLLPVTQVVVDNIPVIVVYEHDSECSTSLTLLLNDGDFQCISVDEAGSVVDILESGCVDVILIDADTVDSATALEAIDESVRDEHSFAVATPAIVVANEEVTLDGLLNVDRFLRRPVDADQLVAVVTEFVSKDYELNEQGGGAVKEEKGQPAIARLALPQLSPEDCTLLLALLRAVKEAAEVGDLAIVLQSLPDLMAVLGDDHSIYLEMKRNSDMLELPKIALLARQALEQMMGEKEA
ncbi:signal transduction histidine kinase [Sinobacterium caligoides]|uniref:histidine kinase n=1 Tax=Sinobacterium caligoides TaxID=933926 RepID=A0A3N2D5B3_9GAMM|nr:ATP-binding protein [Sinobacterium caligoides]ROR94872.1 signal transduction histidine kinase [Sinobacterium caligoides]